MTVLKRELTVSGATANLPEIMSFVEASCQQAGVDPALQFDVQLAVEEACCNVFEHAYEGKGGDLSVSFATCGRDIAITLRDHGRSFNPEQIVPPDTGLPLEERRLGGLGLHLMYKLMDEVRFTFSKGVNKLVMVKRNAVSTAAADQPPRSSYA